MIHRLPPLNALRAFEAAARHGSFPAAARELKVTAGAIGRQVRLLEDYLGVELFHRHPHGVELTELVRQALPKLEVGFVCLAEAAKRLRSSREAPVLILQAAPGLAAKWLMPAPVEDNGHDEAIAIRYGSGPYSGEEAVRLFEITIRPVCSPDVLAAHPLATPEDLADHVLLHDETSHFLEKQPDWAVWLRAAGAQGVDPHKGLTFNHCALAVDAALQGLGVALGCRCWWRRN